MIHESTAVAAPLPAPVATWQGPTSRLLPLIRACELQPDDPLVVVGSVDAELVRSLRVLGLEDVTILDPSLETLQRLRGDLGDLEREVLLIEQEVLDFQPRRRYALWYDCGFFHRLTHAEDRWRYVQMLQFALRPMGHLIITTAGPQGQDHEEGVPVERYGPDRLCAELGDQLCLAEHTLALHVDPEGYSRQLLHCRFQRFAPTWRW